MAMTPMDPKKKQKRGADAGLAAGAGAGAAGAMGAKTIGSAVKGGRASYAMQRGMLGSAKGPSLAASVRTVASGLKAKPLLRFPSGSKLGLATGAGAVAGSVAGSKLAGPKPPTGPKPPAGPPKPKKPGAVAKSGHEAFIEKGKIPAERLSLVGGKFGRIPKPPKRGSKHHEGPDLGYAYPAALGALYGGAAGSLVSTGVHRRELKSNTAKIAANTKQQAANTREIKRKAAVAKRGPKVHRITDMGTIAGKMKFHGDSMGWKEKDRTHLSRQAKGMYGGMAVGGYVGGQSGKKKVAAQKGTLVRQEKRMTKQREILGKSSAFGIDHG